MRYFLVLAFINENGRAKIRWDDHHKCYVGLEEGPTLETLGDAITREYEATVDEIIITGFNEITREAYDAGIAQQEREQDEKDARNASCILV